jgi:glc operon protein GlcG
MEVFAMNPTRSLSSFLVAFLLAVSANAATVEKKSLDLEGARKVIAAAVAAVKEKGAPGGAIAVVDDGGNLIAVERLDGTFPAAAKISIGKARTAAIFRRSTSFFEEVVNKGRTVMVALEDFTPLQGGVPIQVDGQVVGAIGVSGAASAAQDTEIAEAAVAAMKNLAMNPAQGKPEPVTHIDAKKVQEAFVKGAVLVGSEETMMHDGRYYMVHASRRDAPGVAEIHTWDTDVMYVLEGSATLVTGGTALETKTLGPGEIRGKKIAGGENRSLGKGDVVVIPQGTPHWFKEVKAPFLYFVVKPRSPEGVGK